MFVADLHIHSPYAFACSRALTLENLSFWAARKGIDLLSTGDFTHPVWGKELRNKLAYRDDGLYEFAGVRFVPGTEISCVYRQDGKVRRIHMLVLVPTLDDAEVLAGRLSKFGDLSNDGRPTVRLSARDLLALALDCQPKALVVPAHAWTPWYGVFGSKSGFDSLQECFGDLASQITAVETGLSSDPTMNHAVRELDNRAIVSFSDAHSLPRLGREMTAFRGDPSWNGLSVGLREGGIEFTVEFYPEEGKYHYSGHRKCGVVCGPDDESAHSTECPVCGKPLTLGVLHRVASLAGTPLEAQRSPDPDGFIRSGDGRPPFARLIPLQEIIASVRGVGVGTKTVQREYNALVDCIGDELSVLLRASERDLSAIVNDELVGVILKARLGQVAIDPGYDGIYGTVRPLNG